MAATLADSNSPEHAPMLSGEKKIGIQSLSRAQPSLPMTAGAPGQSSASPVLERSLPMSDIRAARINA